MTGEGSKEGTATPSGPEGDSPNPHLTLLIPRLTQGPGEPAEDDTAQEPVAGV